MASMELSASDGANHTHLYSHMTVIQTHQGVPGEPHPPAVMSCTPSSLHLCWTAPVVPAPALPLSYRLMCQVCEGTPSVMQPGQWMVVYEGPNTEVLIPGLCPAGQYNFKLQVCTSASADMSSHYVLPVSLLCLCSMRYDLYFYDAVPPRSLGQLHSILHQGLAIG